MSDGVQELPGINFTGDIHIAGDMFNIHDNQNVTISMSGQPVQQKREVFVPCELEFFNQAAFGSEEKQLQLIELLKQAAANIDVSSGRDWFAMYAAYRYYQDQRGVKGGYTDFFTDIEHLLPNTLTKIKVDKGGEKRYHSYTMLMGREADAWYMDKGKLPPINELTTYKAHFEGDWSRFEKSCKIIIETYKKFKQI